MRHLVDADFIIQTSHCLHLLLAHEVLGRHPAIEFLTLLGIGMVESIDEHIGLLIGSDVATDFLAKDLWVTINIQEIILQLESQADLLAKLIQIVGILL